MVDAVCIATGLMVLPSYKFYVTLVDVVNFFSSISLTIGVSRLMEVQIDLPHLLFEMGFQIF